MNKFFYKNTVLFLLTIVCTEVCAQNYGKISYSEFQKINIDTKVHLYEASKIHSNFSALRVTLSNLGIPSIDECISDIIGSSCTFDYNGLLFDYVDVGNGLELAEMEISSKSHSITIDGITVKIDDNISVIANVFDSAYRQRGMLNGKYAVRVNINNSTSNLIFEYNPSSLKIISVRYFNVVT